MPTYIVRYHTQIEVSVTVDSDDQDFAEEKAHLIADAYLDTVYGNHRDVVASASLDGVGATEVELKDGAS